MVEIGFELRIVEVLRIDYPNHEDRVETEPVGLFFELGNHSGQSHGFRVSIDLSGVTIEFQVQDRAEFESYVDAIYGIVKPPEIKSPLNNLVGSILTGIYFGFVSSETVYSESFQSDSGARVAVLLKIDPNTDFVFWNDGDEGEYSFDLKNAEERIPLESIVWKEQTYLLESLAREKVQEQNES